MRRMTRHQGIAQVRNAGLTESIEERIRILRGIMQQMKRCDAYASQDWRKGVIKGLDRVNLTSHVDGPSQMEELLRVVFYIRGMYEGIEIGIRDSKMRRTADRLRASEDFAVRQATLHIVALRPSITITEIVTEIAEVDRSMTHRLHIDSIVEDFVSRGLFEAKNGCVSVTPKGALLDHHLSNSQD